MKKILISSIFAVATLFATATAFAQDAQVTLPSAGLTPSSPFYFLDRFGENLRQFFTFNRETKAKLQIEFAGERIAEIKIMVEKKGVNAKGLAIAESLLKTNVAYAAEIIDQEKTSGKDVSVLAKTLNDEFDLRDKLLEQTFKDAKEQLKAQRKEIKTKLLTEARSVGDTTQIAVLEAQLKDIDDQIDILGQKKDQLENSLQNEQENIEKEMSEDDQKKEEIEQEEEQEAEDIEEAKEIDEEVDEPKETKESQETDEKESTQDSNSSDQNDQNTNETSNND
ncbi:MAG: hypothetical protein G01um101477_105 [Candidatus Doudnabacteria bacterium Gr01-1014_77]|uniref:DUF5667 domain-containing protein n=1 Tax=Candidatus Doudnabacteria bacterium Gr01-1014_77 TaxID=2017133 RepID=A0A554JDC5_9BACT|nr:MAG: hypothetical protein G01um101477_105 [Candidatus Doudnabacteria bacterium Gr01-1014_77]